MTLEEAFERVPSSINPYAAKGIDAVVQFNCSTPYFATIKDGKCAVTAGTTSSYTLAITTSDEDLLGLMTGKVNPLAAFMAGKIKLDGNMMSAQRVMPLFKIV